MDAGKQHRQPVNFPLARKTQTTAMAQVAYMLLKRSFTTAPILRHPNPNLPFVVEVDASNCRIGAVVSQRHGTGKIYPCAFFS
ncbi:hypothetical protein QTP86_024409 [Hemibagrus guttatus]|nr:hypothetical protein QTP86_024409 [Hemibagrus guttatus]